MSDEHLLEELKTTFFDEAQELVNLLESSILVIEKDPKNKEAINEIFRAAHTLKGGSASLDLDRISNFTHHMESLLDEIRADKLEINQQVIDVLLKAIDVVKILVESSMNNQEANVDENSLIKEMKEFYAPEVSTETRKAAMDLVREVKVSKRQNADYKLTEYDRYQIKQAREEEINIYDIYILFNQDNPMKTVSGIPNTFNS